jgi:hypothetical protein
MLQWLLRVIYSRITANNYNNNNNNDDSKDKEHNISSHISNSIKTQTATNHDQYYLINYFIKPTIRQVKDTLLILGYCLQSSPSYIIFPLSSS